MSSNKNIKLNLLKSSNHQRHIKLNYMSVNFETYFQNITFYVFFLKSEISFKCSHDEKILKTMQKFEHIQ